jgi:UDPglucose--hexose-1-phosphate uridylyltransferase
MLNFVGEFRKDPLTGNWVVVGVKKAEMGETEVCPFCPGNEYLTPHSIREIRDGQGQWLARSFPAANPVFQIEASENKRAEGFYDKMGTLGAHEIIVEDRSHTKTFSTFDFVDAARMVEIYTERIIDLKRDKRFKYVQVFKNHGEITGSRIFHPHSHVFATPIVPQQLSLELANSRNHYLQKERCLTCDVVSQEIRQDRRVVTSTEHFLVICPFASRLSFEVWIIPRRHNASFESWTDEGVTRDFVAVFLDTMKRIERLRSSYSIVFHTSPNTAVWHLAEPGGPQVSDYFHWHVEVLPRTYSKYKREDEFYTVPIMPEETAAILKTEKPKGNA